MAFSNFFQKGHFLGLFAVVSLLLSSCEWFKPARETPQDKVYKDEDIDDIQSSKVYDPETGEWRTIREVSGKLDTVKWTDLAENKFPPITTSTPMNNSGTGGIGVPPTTSTTPSETYNVSLILPFLTQNIRGGTYDENSTLAIQFYGGAKLAYESLRNAGVHLNISVMDSEASTTKMSGLLRDKNVINSDLIIGPYKRENVGMVVGFSKNNKIPLVVPFTAQMGMAINNPFYIQINPSLKSHCEAITKHARNQYRTTDIVLVALDNADEKARLKYFQDANAEIEGQRSGSRFQEMLVADNPAGISKLDVKPYIRRGGTTVFIVPSWSNESFIYSLLRQLMIEQSNGENIVVYGMPAWMNYEQVDYEFFEKLRVHVSSPTYINNNDPRVKQFKQQFFSLYGTVPTEDAFLGYDVMLYFGKMLQKYGKNFPSRIDQEPSDVFQGKFQFERIVLDPNRQREDLSYYDQLENKFVYILKFQDYYFQPAP